MMQNLHRTLSRLSILPTTTRSLLETPSKDVLITSNNNLKSLFIPLSWRKFSTSDKGNENDPWAKPWGNTGSSTAPVGSNNDWDSASSWSTGITKEHLDGEAIGHQSTAETGSAKPKPSVSSPSLSNVAEADSYDEIADLLGKERRKSEEFVRGWGERMKETTQLLKQVMEPGVRGSYLKDSEKAEMYKLHKMNPEVYTVEKLAKDYRVMRQRVHAILWLKEDEEEQEKKLGKPLDDSVEKLLDSFPEFFNSHCREFHVAKLPYKPNFKVMPEGWEGTAREPDEVHYEISMKEDEMLYEEFVQRMNFNKKKIAGEVKCHKYSRRRSDDGWRFTIEKLGPQGKRGGGGGWKFVSEPNGSSRALNEMEKMYVQRETVKRRRKRHY
ncbi:hypothetical protein C5167_049796 [Papaver somniferum]|uniref:Uncharacterized protein n=1 Tax=Papaver somniferum TaxID=3469 RepID=A0A4Y7KQA6_PAPSO|nr:uncharacterized protein LOC113302294 [Papaver somniferum]RZC74318.1 hypothetical protein C5167_049796 [Papaver somniferum]